MQKLSGLIFLLTILFSSCTKDKITRTPPGGKDSTNVPEVTNIRVSTIAGEVNPILGKLIPAEISIDPSNNLYISDPYNNIIAKLDNAGALSLLAGSMSLYHGGFADGIGANAKFNYQHGIVFSRDGNLYVTDYSNERIRKVSVNGEVSTVVKTDPNFNGAFIDDKFTFTHSLTEDSEGNLYACQTRGNKIIKITKAGVISTVAENLPNMAFFNNLVVTPAGDFFLSYPGLHVIYKYNSKQGATVFAGSGEMEFKDGKGSAAAFKSPAGLLLSKTGILYVTDAHSIRAITPDGTVRTIAGSDQKGFVDGIGKNALFNFPESLAMDTKGNLYVADEDNKAIRKITSDGMVSTVYGSNNVAGQTTANVAKFNRPTGIAVDASGSLYVADADNNVIRKIANGKVSLFAGTGVAGRADGLAKTATFNKPTGVNFDKDGNLYVADFGNNNLRKISPSGVVSSIELFVSNNGASGPENDPTSVAVDKNGGIFYTNSKWNTICKIANGLTSTFSNGITINNVDKFFFRPYSIAVDKDGNVYVADSGNHRIVKLDVNGRSTVIAGQLSSGNIPRSGSEDGKGRDASFNNPQGIAVDNKGNIYVADTDNNLIRKITTDGIVTTIAGSLTPGSNDDAPGKKAMFNKPAGLALNPAGTILYVADTGNDIIRKIDLY